MKIKHNEHLKLLRQNNYLQTFAELSIQIFTYEMEFYFTREG